MRVVLIIWLVFLICLSLSPFEVKAHLHSMGRWHNVGHLVAFTVTTILLTWNSRTFAGRVLLSLLAVAFAFGTELLEHLAYHNSFEWHDVYTDCAGILLGLILLTGAQPFLPGSFPQSAGRQNKY